MSDDTTARVCVHGGLRRQCEACDLADRLEVAEAEVRRLQQQAEQTAILLNNATRLAGEAYFALTCGASRLELADAAHQRLRQEGE